MPANLELESGRFHLSRKSKAILQRENLQFKSVSLLTPDDSHGEVIDAARADKKLTTELEGTLFRTCSKLLSSIVLFAHFERLWDARRCWTVLEKPFTRRWNIWEH